MTSFNGFSPTLNWSGDLSGFQGALILQGSSGQTANYTLSYMNTNHANTGGSEQATFDVQSLTTGNVNVQYNNANTPATIRRGDLNTNNNVGTGTITLRNAAANTAVTCEVGALNANSASVATSSITPQVARWPSPKSALAPGR